MASIMASTATLLLASSSSMASRLLHRCPATLRGQLRSPLDPVDRLGRLLSLVGAHCAGARWRSRRSPCEICAAARLISSMAAESSSAAEATSSALLPISALVRRPSEISASASAACSLCRKAAPCCPTVCNVSSQAADCSSAAAAIASEARLASPAACSDSTAAAAISSARRQNADDVGADLIELLDDPVALLDLPAGGVSGPLHIRGDFGDAGAHLVDQVADLPGAALAGLGQRAYFVGDHGEALAVLARHAPPRSQR